MLQSGEHGKKIVCVVSSLVDFGQQGRKLTVQVLELYQLGTDSSPRIELLSVWILNLRLAIFGGFIVGPRADDFIRVLPLLGAEDRRSRVICPVSARSEGTCQNEPTYGRSWTFFLF